MGAGWGIVAIDAIAHEAIVFAAIGLAIGGIDDLAIDMLWLVTRCWRAGRPRPTLAAYDRRPQRRLAVFVAAWDESAVIGAMLRTALARFDHGDYRVYVGAYPNDRATIDAVVAVAARDSRVRLVIGAKPGPTTKADCLNALWRALCRDERRDGVTAAAVILHDAEDVVHAGELRVFDALIGRYSVVQLPVLPLVDRRARLISGHYADEFAEAHGKQLVVRQTLGVGLPLAGVGCAIERGMIGRIAEARGGRPFDDHSLTEDYELGLHIAALGGKGTLARVREREGGAPVAVRAYFPATIAGAVRQKARWMTGIAFAGWDRLGWGPVGDWRDHWMRMRDRRAPLAVLVLASGYGALVAWVVAQVAHRLAGVPPPPTPIALDRLLHGNAALLAWRLAVRALFTGQAYGWREACWSVPRVLAGNVISLLAARRAVASYVQSLRGVALRWDKTAHVFPDLTGDPM
ncbi:glycosyl transferase family protein [Sphingomonas sp. TREG-RG-20F-R18-01]|uniref:glycosyl transferase family protein n=1 Tax=Sphingomonas sp. TREG-RG-20F-R18-01 TaxID=2914982 RepID=UPI001F593A72